MTCSDDPHADHYGDKCAVGHTGWLYFMIVRLTINEINSIPYCFARLVITRTSSFSSDGGRSNLAKRLRKRRFHRL